MGNRTNRQCRCEPGCETCLGCKRLCWYKNKVIQNQERHTDLAHPTKLAVNFSPIVHIQHVFTDSFLWTSTLPDCIVYAWTRFTFPNSHTFTFMQRYSCSCLHCCLPTAVCTTSLNFGSHHISFCSKLLSHHSSHLPNNKLYLPPWK